MSDFYELFDGPCCSERVPWFSHSERLSLLELGTPPKGTGVGHVEYVDQNLKAILNKSKEHAGRISERFMQLRGGVNPFEALGRGPRNLFINRSAMKLANLDSIFNFIDSTLPYFSFLDVCGGPGGFVEYLLGRCRSLSVETVGFGVTLSHCDQKLSSCNWQLDHMHQPPKCAVLEIDMPPFCESNLYLLSTPDGTGNILKRPNLDSVRRDVKSRLKLFFSKPGFEAEEPYVDMVTADGGSEFFRNQYHHEEIALGLVICEVIAMLMNLRVGGIFVLKLFSCHQSCTCEVVYLLSMLFVDIAFVKPVTSRPATGELYLVGRALRPDLNDEHRYNIVNMLWAKVEVIAELNCQKSGTSESLIAPESIFSCTSSAMGQMFLSYCRAVNDSLIKYQLHAFANIFDHHILDQDLNPPDCNGVITEKPEHQSLVSRSECKNDDRLSDASGTINCEIRSVVCLIKRALSLSNISANTTNDVFISNEKIVENKVTTKRKYASIDEVTVSESDPWNALNSRCPCKNSINVFEYFERWGLYDLSE